MFRRLAGQTYANWTRDDGWLYAAAMAAFAALALAPLLIIALRIAESLGSERAVRHGLALIVNPIIGRGAVRALIGAQSGTYGNGSLTVVLSAIIALFSGSRLFYAVQRALHVMWDTPLRRSTSLTHTVAAFLVAALLSLSFIAGITVIIFGSAVIVANTHNPAASFIGATLVGAVILAPVVAALFRWLPGTGLAWSDVWIGAGTTTVGFAIGQIAIGIYLRSVDLPWTYGSAASVIVILLWLYYSAYLFLLGAEFTHTYAREFGSLRRGVPSDRSRASKGTHKR